MFNSSKNKGESVISNNLLNIIGPGTHITGDLVSDGDFRVDGRIDGHVTVRQRLVLGEQGVITGDIEAKDATVAGHLKGNIKVEQTLVLKPSSKIDGDIVTDKIIIESGAQFNGRCSMNQQLTPAQAKLNGSAKAKASAE